jgi:hypothetical protein
MWSGSSNLYGIFHIRELKKKPSMTWRTSEHYLLSDGLPCVKPFYFFSLHKSGQANCIFDISGGSRESENGGDAMTASQIREFRTTVPHTAVRHSADELGGTRSGEQPGETKSGNELGGTKWGDELGGTKSNSFAPME